MAFKKSNVAEVRDLDAVFSVKEKKDNDGVNDENQYAALRYSDPRIRDKFVHRKSRLDVVEDEKELGLKDAEVRKKIKK